MVEAKGVRDFVPIQDVIKRAEANASEQHWFAESAMKFFNTKLPDSALMDCEGRAWFVTSERRVGGERRYSVRVQTPNGRVSTVGEFMAHPSYSTANKVCRDYADGKRTLS